MEVSLSELKVPVPYVQSKPYVSISLPESVEVSSYPPLRTSQK